MQACQLWAPIVEKHLTRQVRFKFAAIAAGRGGLTI